MLLLLPFILTFYLPCQLIRVYRGHPQNKNSRSSAERFRKASVSRRNLSPTFVNGNYLSRGFFLEISVTSRINPYTAFSHSLSIISNLSKHVKRLNEKFLNFFKFFQKKEYFSFTRHILLPYYIYAYARVKQKGRKNALYLLNIAFFIVFSLWLLPLRAIHYPKYAYEYAKTWA